MAKKEVNKENKKTFKSLKAELKKVIWPTPKQLINNTMAVVAIVIILATIVFVLDLAFESVNKYGIDKVKQSIVSINSTDEQNTTTENTVDEAEGESSQTNAVETVESTDTQTNNAE